jgi:hypothetical protein
LKPQQNSSFDVLTAHEPEFDPADTDNQLEADPTRAGDD